MANYKLTNLKSGRVNEIDQETYDVLKRRKHLSAYKVEVIDVSDNKKKYIPEEVKKLNELQPGAKEKVKSPNKSN